MKKVSGTLKLDLAQYRELAAFSQFASDLDEDTRKQLERGERMLELLKQGVYEPVSIPKQTCMLYAGTHGYLDAIKVDHVLRFEEELYAALDNEKSIIKDIVKNNVMSEGSEEKLNDILERVSEMNK
jgi:F-type H+-transporting ATPase subunit alpha